MARLRSVKSYQGSWIYTLRAIDALSIVFSGLAAHWSLHAQQPLYTTERLSIVVALLAYFVVAGYLSLYQPWRGRRLLHELLLGGTALAGMTLAMIATHALVLSDPSQTSMLYWAATWFAIALPVQWTGRMLLHVILGRMHLWGKHQRRVALVGFNAVGAAALNAITRYPHFGFLFCGYFDERHTPRNGFLTPDLRLGGVADMQRVIEERGIDQIWIALPFRAEERAAEVLAQLQHSTVNIRYLVDVFAFKRVEKRLTDVIGIPMLDLDVTPMEGVNRYLKAAEDRLFALFLLVLVSPLMIAIAIGVKMSSPGPVLFRQERVSWNNQRFTMFKFRSMPVEVERETGPKWASSGEQRATRFGSLLRKTSLDELPQLLNVLRGDMSIVGPRPERPCFVETFKEQIPDYMKKHMVKAGITGWAQVNGWRGDSDLSRRIECDLFYIQNWSLLFDFKIAMLTVFRGFVHKNAY